MIPVDRRVLVIAPHYKWYMNYCHKVNIPPSVVEAPRFVSEGNQLRGHSPEHLHFVFMADAYGRDVPWSKYQLEWYPYIVDLINRGATYEQVLS